MFIERSTARIRTARALFVLLGILPCAGLAGWAVARHSAGYREAIERRCERAVGLPLEIGGVEHLRPDGLRLRDCRLSSPAGGVVLSIPEIEVESSPRELRLTLGRVDCTPELARLLAGLATEWLRQPVRFPLDCVIDVEDFSWRPRGPSGAGAGGLRVECVAANGSRAVRVRRSARGGAADEVRVVAGAGGRQREAGVENAVGEPDECAAAGMEVHGHVVEPLPIAVLEAVAGLEPGSLPCGEGAAVSGDLASVFEDGLSSGSARVRVEQIDLATASRHLPHRLSGEALLEIERIEWNRGKVAVCECRWAVSRGRVGQRLLDACVSVLGCRPGPGFRSLARDEVRSFDTFSGRLRIEDGSLDLDAEPGRDGAIARIQGLSMLDEPQVPVPLDRMAWLLAPPGAAAVPAAGITAWLIGCFNLADPAQPPRPAPAPPAGGTAAGNAPASPPSQAGRPLRRKEF